jgi:uncharacterized protein (DUF849 family)
LTGPGESPHHAVMNREVIVTCAVTGAGDTAGKHPELPITPEQIADAAIEAARAGAAIAHIHVRDPATGAAGRDPACYREVVERVRASDCDVVLNLTAGMGGDWTPDAEDPARAGAGSDMVGPVERLVHVEELRPEICSLDCGSLNFGDAMYLSPAPYLREMAALIRDWGVKPELECFEMGHVRLANELVRSGLVEAPPFYQLALGAAWGAPADAETMLALSRMIPADAEWAGFGISRMQMPLVAQAVLLGGHVRVGLEDNLYLDSGTLASNGELVERAVHIIESIGARVLGPDEARKRLGLRTA